MGSVFKNRPTEKSVREGFCDYVESLCLRVSQHKKDSERGENGNLVLAANFEKHKDKVSRKIAKGKNFSNE